MSRWTCKDYLKGTCNNSTHFVKGGTLQNACSTGRSGRPGKKRDYELKRGPTGPRSSNAREVGCVFQDMKPPKSTPEDHRHAETSPTCKIHESYSASHSKFETKILRSHIFAQVDLISTAPTLQNLRTGLRKRQKWQEQGAREAAWKLSKSVFKNFNEHERAAFFSPSENRCLLASNLKPELREFVVDSGASMHMISKKDLSDAEMDTLTKSCSPTIVITANGEVQTHEEAIVYVKELDFFLTKVLENTPAVLSLGKLCDENVYFYEWINGQKRHLIKDGIRIPCNTENFVPFVVPGLSSSSSGSSSTSKTPQRHLRDRRVIPHHLLQPHVLLPQ